MSLTSLFRKATNLFGLTPTGSPKPAPLDGEIIYCKNNVCVHPPAGLNKSTVHHPGYLNIRSQDDDVLGSTLILTWIPNSTLKKNPHSIENSPAAHSPRPASRRSPRQEYSKSDPPSCYSPEDESRTFQNSTESTPQRSQRHSIDSLAPVVLLSPAHVDTNSKNINRKTSVGGNSVEVSHIGNAVSGTKHRTRCETEEIPMTDLNKIEPTLTPNNERSEKISAEQSVRNSERTMYIGKNVNQLREKNLRNEGEIENGRDSAIKEKITNIERAGSVVNDSSVQHVISAQSNPAARRILRDQEAERRRSSSSNKSVASIEMDGDNIVVITEESVANDDSAFHPDDNKKVVNSVKSGGDNDNTAVVDEGKDNTTQTKLESNKVDCCNDKSEYTTTRHDLTLNFDDAVSFDDKVSDYSFHIPGVEGGNSTSAATDASGSASTSGPDSLNSSPQATAPVAGTRYLSPDSPVSVCGSMGGDLSEEAMTDSQVLMMTGTVREGDAGGETGAVIAVDQVCGVFSVDLGQMRSLRIFYSDNACTSGQVVIASREGQYKILHFHHGGLDRLVETFSDWKFLAQPKRRFRDMGEMKCKHFSVIRPYLTNEQCHPEEGAIEMIHEEVWRRYMDSTGRIEDDFHLRKAVFFSGLEASLRHEIWPFLLHYYPYKSTFEEREQIRNDRYIEYQNIRKARESMTEAEKEVFWKNVQCTVEKDVVRTDRSHIYFKGDGNPNIEVLKNILLNYAVALPEYGYTQGMSDLLAPVLIELQNEIDAYWCFVGLMRKTTFFSSPKDIDMDSQLTYLRELLRILLPHFHQHMCKVQDGLELLFCHRWLLLCFKREFHETDALRMWESCWARYQTEFFHLFICVSIISVYGEDVVQQDLPADEMLLHFSSLSMHMSGGVILRKARGLLHQFRTLPTIPCTLYGVCCTSSTGMWDNGQISSVECVGNHPDNTGCPALIDSANRRFHQQPPGKGPAN